MTKTELREEWETRVVAFKASGQSASAWCATHDLKPHQLWYWLKKFKNIESSAVKPFQWLSVEFSGQKPNIAQGGALLVTVGQATVEVKPGFNPALFSDVVRILAELC